MLSSTHQDRFVEIAEQLLQVLEKKLPELISMGPVEVRNFAESCNEVLKLCMQAQTFDHDLEKKEKPWSD